MVISGIPLFPEKLLEIISNFSLYVIKGSYINFSSRLLRNIPYARTSNVYSIACLCIFSAKINFPQEINRRDTEELEVEMKSILKRKQRRKKKIKIGEKRNGYHLRLFSCYYNNCCCYFCCCCSCCCCILYRSTYSLPPLLLVALQHRKVRRILKIINTRGNPFWI